MAQAIKYQTTTVDPGKSASEIQQLVQKYGGTRCEIRWDGAGQVVGVRFAIRHDRLGEVPVSLKARTDRIYEILQGSRRYKHRHREQDRAQAYRIAWRQLKDFVEQALLAVHTGLFPLHEAFMAAVETVDPETGETTTVGELFDRHAVLEAGVLRLNPGPPVLDVEYELEG